MLKQFIFLVILLPVVHNASSYADLWEYPGYYWKTAYPDADTYWLSIYADDCNYILTKWNTSTYADTYDYSNVQCSETLNNNFDNGIDECDSNSDCNSMLLQVLYENHESNLEHWGDHIVYLYRSSASLEADTLTTTTNWTDIDGNEADEVATTYVEKNENEPLAVSCYFVTFTVDCNDYGPSYFMIPRWYYESPKYDASQIWNDSYNFSIANTLSNKEYIYQECDLSVLLDDSYSEGIHYCVKSQEYTLIGKGSNSSSFSGIELSLYVSQYGETLIYWELYTDDVKISNINISSSSNLEDNDDCTLYSQTSYYSWIGDGTCDGELNKYPCWDGGDCCNSTCEAHENSELRVCGERGYHCIDPNATEYNEYLDTYSMDISVTVNSDKSIDVLFDSVASSSYSINSADTNDGYYVLVIDHTSGESTDFEYFDSSSMESCTQFVEYSVPYQQFVLIFGYGGSSTEMLSNTILEGLGLSAASIVDNLDDELFVFLGKKGGNSSIADNSYIDYVSEWPAYTYEPSTFFQYHVSSSSATLSATLWFDDDCEFEDISYRYYVLDDIGTSSSFSINGELTYFSSSYACSTTTSSYDDIVDTIAVVLDWSSCNTSLKIANAQLYGAAAIIVINTRNNGKPNIVWYDNTEDETRGLSTDDITIPVLSVGFSDGSNLWSSFSKQYNTWREWDDVYIYKFPNYTIDSTRRCATPVGLYEINYCDSGSTYEYDNCTTCGCDSNGDFTCETDDCLDSYKSNCIECHNRVFTKGDECCGTCAYNLDECGNGGDTDDSGSGSSSDSNCIGYNCEDFSYTETVLIWFFAAISFIILCSIAIVARFQRHKYGTAQVDIQVPNVQATTPSPLTDPDLR